MAAKVHKLNVINPAVRDVLIERAIDPDACKSFDFAYLTEDEHRQLHPNHTGMNVPGMVINYFDPHNTALTPIGFRTKVLGKYEITGKNGKIKEMKYLHPKGAGIHLYFPGGGGVWSKLLKDPTREIAVTEGELKALCLTLLDVPTIGLAGVDAISQNKRPLTDWSWVEFEGRRVVYIADSDYYDKPAVRGSVERTILLLTELGANVFLWVVEALSDLEKTGVDDFIKRKGLGEAKAAIEAAAPADNRTPVVIKTGQLHNTLQLLAGALVKANVPYFRRGNGLVRAETLEHDLQEESGFWQPSGSLRLEILTSARLAVDVSAKTSLRAYNKQGALEPRDLPESVARSFIATGLDFKCYPYIRAISHVPLMREDGSILLDSGLDPVTGILVDARGFDFAAIKLRDKPTHADAISALAAIRLLFADFPFDNEASFSAHLSCLFTGLLRSGIPTTPIFGISAPTWGVGKTLLADCISLIVTGRSPSLISMKGNEETFETQIEAALLAATPIVCIDNVTQALTGRLLAAITTSEITNIRLFHTQSLEPASNHSLWIATGVNLRTGHDIKRRALVYALDTNDEHPERRQKFAIKEIQSYIVKHRHEVLGHLFTILRAYAQEKKKPRFNKLGSFEYWSDRVLGPITWLKLDDPTVKIDEMNAEDPVREIEASVFAGLRKFFGKEGFTGKRIADACNKFVSGMAANQELRDALADLRQGGQWDAKRIGQWLGYRKGKVIDGLKLVLDKNEGHTAIWRIVAMTKE